MMFAMSLSCYDLLVDWFLHHLLLCPGGQSYCAIDTIFNHSSVSGIMYFRSSWASLLGCSATYSLKLIWFIYIVILFSILMWQAHLRTLRGRILETILSLRFFIFQYGIVYKLDVERHSTSLAVNTLFISLPYFFFTSFRSMLYTVK